MLPAMTETNRLFKAPTEPATDGRGSGTAVPLSRLQRTVARRMVAAKTEIPEFTGEVEIDFGAVRELREEMRGGDFVPSLNDFVVAACAGALRDVPKLNASFEESEIVVHSRVNVGVAVAADGMLVVPTIFDADAKSLAQIGAEARELAGRARAGSLRLEEMADQTFTVSNLGMHGIGRFTAIVSPPQVGILAVGALRETFVPVDGAPVARPLVAATLTADHRAVYGADAAAFLAALKGRLEQPLQLLRTIDIPSEEEG
jgi:pyruvate dehydrogenase E2 component (dihydrolipoamide acetyltransferase)